MFPLVMLLISVIVLFVLSPIIFSIPLDWVNTIYIICWCKRWVILCLTPEDNYKLSREVQIFHASNYKSPDPTNLCVGCHILRVVPAVSSLTQASFSLSYKYFMKQVCHVAIFLWYLNKRNSALQLFYIMLCSERWKIISPYTFGELIKLRTHCHFSNYQYQDKE